MSLTDEDTNSILTDNDISEIPSKQCDNACGATLWPNLIVIIVKEVTIFKEVIIVTEVKIVKELKTVKKEKLLKEVKIV